MDVRYFLSIVVFIFNSCIGLTQSETPAQNLITNQSLDSVMTIIETDYHTDQEFLIKLKSSQIKWSESVLADLDMRFPISDKTEYGSVYPTCYKFEIDKAIATRIEFLNEWIEGVQEGNVCAGSVRVK